MDVAGSSASELRYRRLFEAAYDGILIVDPKTRAIVEVNPFLSRLLGYTREELLGRELFEIGLLGDEANSQAAFCELRTNGCIRYEDLPLQTKDGRRVEVEFVSNLYQEGDHQVIQCNVRDITARKQAELQLLAIRAERDRLNDEVAKARDVLEQANRAKDHFIAVLSHELRTPLNPILLLASDAAVDPAMPSAAQKMFAAIVKNLKQEVRLIDDLGDVTRITHGKMPLARERVDVHSALRDAIATVRGELEGKQITLRLSFRAGKRSVMADPMRLQQIFWNVLRNAAKFTDVGGEIDVETSDSSSGAIRIKIADTGIGMTEQELGRLFISFSQGDHASASGSPRFGGMGLGLSIAKMLVELHAGTIRAESAGPHLGSTFWIELPVEPVPPGARHAQTDTRSIVGAAVRGAPRVRIRRLLLVEDHEPTRRALTHLLVRRHYHVVPVGSVAEARAAAAAEKFDLLISDLGLPDGPGNELMADLHDRFRLRGIALTGSCEDENAAGARQAGVLAHLLKPVSIQALEGALTAAESVA